MAERVPNLPSPPKLVSAVALDFSNALSLVAAAWLTLVAAESALLRFVSLRRDDDAFAGLGGLADGVQRMALIEALVSAPAVAALLLLGARPGGRRGGRPFRRSYRPAPRT